MARTQRPQTPSPRKGVTYPLTWTQGRSEKERDAILFALENNTTLIYALLDILNRMEQEELRSERNIDQYDVASWAYKQADRNGAIRVLDKIKSLFINKEPNH